MFTFTSKARVLETLKPLVREAKIESQVRFSVGEWKSDSEKILKTVQEKLGAISVIVRSSAKDEDSEEESKAGMYLSLLDVDASNLKELKSSIQDVSQSFGNSEKDNEIFIQPFLKDIVMSGVVFTRDIDTGSPYYIINYDEQSSRTDSVTKGDSNELKTFVIFRDEYEKSGKLLQLLKAVREIEHITNSDSLDIEFAIQSNGEVTIFQTRPLICPKGAFTEDGGICLDDTLLKLNKKLKKLIRPFFHLDGEETYFGVMPDWNPAEIIGVRPRTLALSLYRELITDAIWAYQRFNYGYKDLRSFPLMVSFLGIPYVDIRLSFNSFVPAELSKEVSSKLVNYYLRKIKGSPEHHDKIEFDIVFSSYYLNIQKELQCLKEEGFSESEITELENSLLLMTNEIIDLSSGLFSVDMKKIEELDMRYHRVTQSDEPILEKIYWLVEDCKRYGTLPFAGIARSAFIAMQFLKSMLKEKIFTDEQYHQFLNSLDTVSSQLQKDLNRLKNQEITQDEFNAKHGHLRPGTYDILSLRYDEDFHGYFSNSHTQQELDSSFKLTDKMMKRLGKALVKNRIAASPEEFMTFIRSSIEGREYAKFIFTRNLSEILSLMVELGSRFGISREDMSFVNIHRVLELYANLDHRDVFEILTEDIKINKKYYEVTKAIKLPHLIFDPDDIYAFHLPEGKPNFITLNRVVSDILLIEEQNKNCKGKIVLIPSADPGYDWIFAHQPAGLVTTYGGVNSHMAIRCAEMNIPAVIGAGEKNFNVWKKAKTLEIDCINQLVQVFY